ncbi:hypothetical protein HDU84_002377 [Entophlyctis sp. JEL0112]|nr:hypothetical protein HDU84_002377 [Entophlyctis sp. JEL0112]
MPGSVVEVKSSEEFYKQLAASKVVIVDYWAEWCAPCKTVSPKFTELSDRYPEVRFLKVETDEVDLDECDTLQAMPTFRAYVDGVQVGEVVGARVNQFQSRISSASLTVVDFTVSSSPFARHFPHANSIIGYMVWALQSGCAKVRAFLTAVSISAFRFAALAAQYPNTTFLKVDVDRNRDISSSMGIRAMPTFMVFKNGAKIDEIVGADIGRVERLIDMYGDKFPNSGGQTLGDSSGSSGTAGTAYVNPWQDSNPTRTPKASAISEATSTDRATLIDMGFAPDRVDAALKATNAAGLQPCLDWLFANPEVTATPDESNDDAIHESEATAQSLKCDDCGRLLPAAAEFHAVKSGHQNFSESVQAIKPLTEDEKKAKLAELKAKLAARKEEKRQLEIEENKAKEKVRRATGKELVEMKERMAELEMKKVAEAKRREKEADRIAKEKIKAQIEQDKKERAARAEKERLERQGMTSTSSSSSSVVAPTAATSTGPKEYIDTRIQIRLASGGAVTQTFKATDTVEAVYAHVSQRTGSLPGSFKLATTFPRQVLDDESKTLKDLGLVPSAALAMV